MPPKPKGALAVMIAGGPAPKGDEPMSSGDSSFRAVAKAFGIPPEREASAKAALHQYVMSCMGDSGGDDDDEAPDSEGY